MDSDNLSARVNLVSSIVIDQWGHEVTLICTDYLSREKSVIKFHKCTTVTLSVYGENINSTMLADIIGLDLGEEHYRKSAVIHTDIFEALISYDRLDIQQIQ